MKMNIQFIEKNGRRTHAVLPIAEYQRLLDRIEHVQDLKDQDLKDIERAGHDEVLPAELVYQLLDTDMALPVWRKYRGLTQAQLADKSGVKQAYIAQIETGVKKGGLATWKKLARAMNLSIDDLV